MTFFKRLLVLSVITVTPLSFNVHAKMQASEPNPLPKLQDAPRFAKTTKSIISLLGSEHYNSIKINDELSADLLNNYINNLDPSKTFFLKKDMDDFSRYETSLDDALNKADNTAAFTIYTRFRERLIERLGDVIALLNDDDFIFDFTKDENLDISDNKQWHTDKAEAKEYWRKRLKGSLLAQKLSGEDVDKARKQLVKNYTNQLERITKQSSNDVYEIYINSFTELYDPHTTYMSPRATKDFYISMSLSLEGIGAVLQTEDEHTKILRIVTGGPASKQGELQPADKIIGVGQGDEEIINVVGWRLNDVVDLIRGDKGTSVTLNVISSDSQDALPKMITIVRDKIELEDQDAQKGLFEVQGKHGNYRIGVISLPTFYLDFEGIRRQEKNIKRTTTDVRRLLEELRKDDVDGIVLDLRNNGGGALSEAIGLTDLFIDKGPVVQIRHSKGFFNRVGVERSYRQALYRGPLVVLVNRLSASASEILAGALQDYNRALIVGSQTFGKGTVQTLKDLSPEEKLKLTQSKFYRVSGASTQHRGVIPDIKMPEMVDTEKVGEDAYERALPWDTISPAPHSTYKKFDSVLAELKRAHQDRIKIDPDFVYIREQLALSEEMDQRDTLSLNENVRQKEQAELEQRSLAIANKRRIAKQQKPFESIKQYKAFEKEKQTKAQQNAPIATINADEDAILREAGLILMDLIEIKPKK